jgi:hypothetical protein
MLPEPTVIMNGTAPAVITMLTRLHVHRRWRMYEPNISPDQVNQFKISARQKFVSYTKEQPLRCVAILLSSGLFMVADANSDRPPRRVYSTPTIPVSVHACRYICYSPSTGLRAHVCHCDQWQYTLLGLKLQGPAGHWVRANEDLPKCLMFDYRFDGRYRIRW